jgi:hypothetical protein
MNRQDAKTAKKKHKRTKTFTPLASSPWPERIHLTPSTKRFMFVLHLHTSFAHGGDMLMGEILNKNTARKIIERLRGLPPQQLDEVIQFIDSIAQRRRSAPIDPASDEPNRSILALRGRGKGEHLVERLLQSRREDQGYDERR